MRPSDQYEDAVFGARGASRPVLRVIAMGVSLGWVGFVNGCLSARRFEKYVERVDATLLKMGNIHPGDRYRAIGRTGAPF